ncbi:colony stimulating factor 3 (granulocyte) b [Channa argus]|uniref:colony stimulating factor 3 (granulocyte) b n=1 Tax=Channa argus TaxID=215402 RepID=UPI0029487C2E|nr:hypothetical protein Q8A73_016778 [Channa argus]
MNAGIVVALLHCFLFAVLVQSAPTAPPPLAFREAVERTKALVEKILTDLPTVHAATVNIQGLTLDSSSQTANLQMMVMSLGISASPVIKPLSEHFTLDMCVGRMLAGSQLYKGILGVLSERLSGLSDLKAELRDLHLHINKMKEVAKLSGTDSSDQSSVSDLAARLQDDYKVQVAVHLTLSQLRSFCHDMIRSLRNIATNTS